MLVGIEMVYLRLSPVYWGFGIPPGDGSAVVVIPGFLLTDLYLTEFRSWINRIGYKAYFSGIGMNAECPNLLHPVQADRDHREGVQGDRQEDPPGGAQPGRRDRPRGGIADAGPHCVGDHAWARRSAALPCTVHLSAAQMVRGQILERHGKGVLPACYTAGCTCNFLESLVVKLPKSVLRDRDLYQVRWNRGLAGLPDGQSRRRFRSLGNPHRNGLQSDRLRRSGPPPGGQDPRLGRRRSRRPLGLRHAVPRRPSS